MSLYIRLNEAIDPKVLLNKIKKEIDQNRKDDGDILAIEVKHVTEVVEKITMEQVKNYLSNK